MTFVRAHSTGIILFTFFLCAAVAGAQTVSDANPNVDSPEWIRPPSSQKPLTRKQIDAAIAQYWVSTDDQVLAYRALDYIASLIHEGEISANDREMVSLLGQLSSEGLDQQVRAGSRVLNDFPLVRARAIRLLGLLRGAEALSFIEVSCRKDPSPEVRTAAVAALAEVAPIPSKRELSALTAAMSDNNVKWQDGALASTAMRTVRIFYMNTRKPEASGIVDPFYVSPILKDVRLFQAVADVAFGPYAGQVRLRAIEVLNLLRDVRNR